MAMTPLQSVLWDVKQRIENDKKLSKLRQKVNSGKATYADTAAYSTHVGNLLGDTFAQHILSVSPELREALTVELLHDRYMDINAIIDRVQKSMDEAQGFHLAPQHAPFFDDRAHQIGSALADPTVPDETIKRRARAATATATKSMHDDRMKTEAKFRSRAGLKCTVNRVAAAKCCEWCDQVAGKYAYEDTPPDLWRRHDNCNCTIVYGTRRDRQVLRGTEKKWEIVAEGAGAGEPVVLTKEQARNAGADQPIRFSKAERMAAVGVDLIQAEPIEHSVEEKLELAKFAKSLGFEYKNAMSFDGDSDLLREQLTIMASLRDTFKLPRRVVLYVKDLGEDLGVTYYRKTIMINSSALRSDYITSAYLSADNKLSSTKTIGIGVHEIGHLIAEKYGEIGLDIAQKACYNISGNSYNYQQTLFYLLDNVSKYSVKKNPKAYGKLFKPTHYHEIIPEVLGKHFTNPDEFTTEFFKLLKEVCGV